MARCGWLAKRRPPIIASQSDTERIQPVDLIGASFVMQSRRTARPPIFPPTGAGSDATMISGNPVAEEFASRVRVAGNGDAYVVGTCRTYDFPTTPGAYQMQLAGSSAAYLSVFNARRRRDRLFDADRRGRGAGVNWHPAWLRAMTLPWPETVPCLSPRADLTFPTTSGAYRSSHAIPHNSAVPFVTHFNSTGRR